MQIQGEGVWVWVGGRCARVRGVHVEWVLLHCIKVS